ncbi:unnamed protein product [Fraxinus pennsylvanica]|uniref:Protein kinase domain-containing protein n=1 Tax=Fraxinus pennsylvanica TaxID=56036 RepID=A0AAD1YSJ0_9LAMI|nr:unnamed protein product [Fraxinus pennsylvanica]
MYASMNSPSQLDGWKSSGGDPCDQSWKGITCSGSKVTEIDLSGLGLSGSIGYKLSGLETVTYLDLSGNEFNGNVPYSIAQMTDLKELYLNNNQLNGQLSDMFGQLSKLTKMDLSSNSLSGDLPQSFKNLSTLSTLYLQNNKFTGSINVLSNLPLDDLTGGNSWSSGPAPPPPPGTKSDTRASQSNKENEKSGLSGVAIAGIVLGFLIILGIVINLFSRRSTPPPTHYIEDNMLSPRRPFTPLSSGELSSDFHAKSHKEFRELKSFKSSSSNRVKGLQASPSISLKLPSSTCLQSFNNNEFANNLDVKTSSSVAIASYSLADLQTATGNFATGCLLGEGSMGRVYRAQYADGRVLAVKKIDSSLFHGERGEGFADIVSNISKICHPNVTELIGYCKEQGQNMLVYEYFRNGSLHEFLHLSDDFSKPLTWNTRVRIALGTAHAVE